MFYTATVKKQEGSMNSAESTYKPAFKVGILGGGQLARMLALKGADLGLEIHILSEKESDPAAQVVKHWHKGSPQDAKVLESFFKAVELVTFESEFYSGDLLSKISAQTKVPVSPEPRVMRMLQDRLTQKESLIENHILTADFIVIHNKDDLKNASEFFRNKFIIKKRTGGYDGNGTFVVKNQKDLHNILEKISIAGNEYIAEAYVAFKRELAVIMARNAHGDIIHFPLVQTKQTENRCDWVVGPEKHPKFNSLIRDLAVYIDSIKYVGVIAFELFDTGQNLLVNEIAPRVHNSGHYSLNAMTTDQFTQHWLAVLGFDFFESKMLSKAFAMTNLVGTSSNQALFPKKLEGTLCWYGKLENRPGRKMGHLNYTGTNSKSLLKIALRERKKIKNLGPL